MSNVTAFNFDSNSDQVVEALSQYIKGKNIIVSGATWGGLGSKVARAAAKYANLVIIGCRTEKSFKETIAHIHEESPQAGLRGLIMDFGTFDGARQAAATVNAYPEPIHVFISNAGIMAAPFSQTPDGFESHLAINHLAPFLFTSLIFPRLVAAGTPEDPARFVNITSWGHNASPFHFDDYNFSGGKTYDRWLGYGQSKTANILFVNELARRTKEKSVPVAAFAVHPGTILGTDLGKYVEPTAFHSLGLTDEKGEWLIPTKTLPQGAATHLVAAFDPSVIPYSGAYMVDGNVDNEARAAHASSQEDGEKLWALSESLVKHDFII
ncbi:NAD(P)-binding protein [Clavulina sp. PMI_390]|nr:NAD(P)-binding protein [Clavulina sp. PMI_390]